MANEVGQENILIIAIQYIRAKDKLEKTSYINLFFTVYANRQELTIEELSEKFYCSISTIQRKMKKYKEVLIKIEVHYRKIIELECLTQYLYIDYLIEDSYLYSVYIMSQQIMDTNELLAYHLNITIRTLQRYKNQIETIKKKFEKI